jgi:hypothetical protein
MTPAVAPGHDPVARPTLGGEREHVNRHEIVLSNYCLVVNPLLYGRLMDTDGLHPLAKSLRRYAFAYPEDRAALRFTEHGTSVLHGGPLSEAARTVTRT